MRIPLTRGQLNVWLADQLLSDAAVLGVPFILDVPVRLDTNALVRAFQTLVNSDESLRTIVEGGDHDPVAVIAPRVPAPVEVVAATGDPDAFLAQWLSARVSRRFILHERLFDAAIVVLGTGRTVWYLNLHHLITDGWSIRVLAGHLAALYDQALAGILPDALPLPRYSEYVAWLAAHEASDQYGQAREFWTRKLAARPERPALYGRLPRMDVQQAFRVARVLDLGRSEAVRVAAARVSASARAMRAELAVFAASLAAWQSRVSGVSTISIGIPYHNRRPQFRETIGLFATVVPLVVSIDGGESFETLHGRVHAELSAALDHGHYPLAHTLHAPIYHSVVNVRPAGSVALAGVTAPIRLVHAGRQDGAVALGLTERPDGRFTLEFDFSNDVFGGGDHDRAIHHFLACLDACAARPGARLDDVDLLGPQERATLLTWSHGTRRPRERDGSCADWIFAHAGASGAGVAIVDGDTALSYAQLARRARQMASELRRRGVSTDVPVGIALERSAAAIVSMLGVLAAGGAYLPIDLAWPDERTAFVLADAGVPLVMTTRSHHDRLRQVAPAGCEVLVPDELGASPGRNEPALHPGGGERLPPRTGDPLAYIIYTSGSTGRPKGVAIADSSMANHADACARRFGLAPGDRVLQFRRLVFDGSVEEIYPTLVAGATLVLRPDAAAADFQVLSSFVTARGVTVLELPTAYWHEWVHALAASSESVPASVRLLAVGGEEPSAGALADWHALTGGRMRWLNMYGPTETTVTATVFEATEPVRERVPMGRPLDNASAYVLDGMRRMVPIGTPGELYIGGAGVARGYVNQPELTRERFVADPFAGGGARMYRTGDAVRYRGDGLLEYLGRSDDQIKMRGYRIELAEIDHALRLHPGIARAAVLASGGSPASTRLTACIVERSPVSDRELRSHLRARIPEYMLPAAFVRVDRLPLTPGGKVDRKALISLAAPSAEPAAAVLGLRNPVEAHIASVWERVLGVSGVGPTDSFVELGGHSLLAARLVHDLGEAFGRRVPLAVMFPDATVEKIAGALREADADRLSRPIWTANLEGACPPLVYFHGDYSGGGFYAAQLARLLGHQQPLLVVHPHGVDTPDVPPTIEEMARDRLPHILAALRPGAVLVGGYCNGGLLAVETARLLVAAGHQVLGIVMLDATNDNVRFRRLAALAGRYARWRGLSPARTRELLLRWFDRRATLEQLMGLNAGAQRFTSIGQRLAFLGAAVKRRLLRSTPEDGVARRKRAGTSRHEVLFDEYALATEAYVAAPFDGPIALIVSDDLPLEATVEQWAPVAREVTTYRVSGDHRDAVTGQLASVAEIVARIVAAYGART